MARRLTNDLTGRAARLGALAVAALLLGGAGSFEALFAPKAELWPRWTAHDETSRATVDHGAWDRLLAAYVHPSADGINRVDYRALGQGAAKAALDGYIKNLTDTPISRYRRTEQRAFWIDLYNAVTVRLVAERYPVASIRDIDISPGLFSRGPWDKKLVTVEGEAVSLNDIEHRILRPIWRDPRIHYAVNCASLGCPNLQRQAFTAANSEALLDQGARDYVNNPRGVHFDGTRLIVSSLYVWYGEDFGGSDAAIIAHLRNYAAPALATRLAAATSIDGDNYDWALNGLVAR
ncbi:MAG: DUF547 domain-containing protein [Candidatus Eiseniibacteriota bacterium]